MTPMMEQYSRIKRQYADAILLYRMGDFYEMFHEDARVASRILGLVLTSREKGENAIPMCGLPHHAATSYVRRLIRAGEKVAICEQMEDPSKAKGVVERDVVQVITPGTITDDGLLEEKRSNYLAAACRQEGIAGLAWVDLTTGRFFATEVEPGAVPDEIARIAPAECLVPEGESIDGARCPSTPRPPWSFDVETATRALEEQFGTVGLDGFGCADLTAGVAAAGAVLEYLRETQKSSLGQITSLGRFSPQGHLVLDATTLRNLEVVETTTEGATTLLAVLDETETAMGGRLLREWLVTPLAEVEPIHRRQEAVAQMVAAPLLRERLRTALKEIRDLERIAGRIAANRANARDLLALASSLETVPTVTEAANEIGTSLMAETAGQMDPLEPLRDLIERAIAPDAPPALRDGGIIREGFNPELDALRGIGVDGRAWLEEFREREATRTGIPSLKIGRNNVFGFYIEVTNAHRDLVPADYVRKQTLKNAERYITEELKEHENQTLGADERAKALELEIFQGVRAEVAETVPSLQRTAAAVAEADAAAALAEAAARNDYCRPSIDDGDLIEIADGRHPVIERTLRDDRFVPNDVRLDGEESRLLIVTGPNMAGKSTYIRQVALLVLMAQTGSFIPAASARIGVADRIFTRVGASDELHRGRSTFMVEMTETANILNNATDRSLIILDEVGRGTSTYDGVSIAWAVSEYLLSRVGARTLFATHYHELTSLAEEHDDVRNLNVAVREWKDEVIFLRKIVEGGTDRSYGIHVARLAGIPGEVVERAGAILALLEAGAVRPQQRTPGERRQLALFDAPEPPVVRLLREIDVENMTPVQALLALKELKEKTEE